MLYLHQSGQNARMTQFWLGSGYVTLTLAAIVLTPLIPAPALAQANEGAETSVDDNAIIVTAQRRAEAIENVPMTVTVLSQAALSNAGVSSVRDLANLTTGFQIGNAGTVPQPAIRGITTVNSGPFENNVALFVDGLYQTTPQVLNMDLPNVQSVQVLKGPQGTLYGRNATGGAILIDTIDPTQDWEGNVEATYGRFKDRRARGYVAGPLSESVGISIAGTYRKTEGYYKRASITTPGAIDGRFLGLDQQAVRAKLKFEVTPDFRVTLGYNYLRANDPRGTVFTPIENVNTSYVDNPATPYVDGNATRARKLGVASGDIFGNDLKSHEGFVRLELDTSIGTLRSVTGYTSSKYHVPFDFTGSYATDSYITSITRDRTWQESVDFTINAIDNVDLIIGGNYYNIKTDYPVPSTTFLDLTGSPPGTPISSPSYIRFQETALQRTKKAWAAFIDATFHATDKLSINVGGRYSKEVQDVAGFKNNYNPATGVFVNSPYTLANSARRASYSQFTPRASIRYEIADNTNIYASYSKGFRGGEWPITIPSDNPALWRDARQETVDAFEVGIKSAGSRLNFEAAGFYYKYKDLQVAITGAVNGLPVQILQSVPRAKIYGIEGSFDYEIVYNLKFRGGATWLHARYGDGFYFIGQGVNPAATGFNPNNDPLKQFPNRANVVQDLAGKQMSRSPNFTAFAGLDYLIPNEDGGLRFAANARYTDSYVVTVPAIFGGDTTANPFDNDPTNDVVDNTKLLAGTPYVGRSNEQRFRQSKFVMLNASVTWTDPSGQYYVRAWGNNLGNVKYKLQYSGTASGTYAQMAEPLTYGLTIGAKFK